MDVREGGGEMTKELRRIARGAGLVAVVALAATVTLAAACGDDDDGGELEPVTLMLDWTPNMNHAGIYLAKANGWYEDEGIDLTIIEPGQTGVDQVVASGEAEFGISVQENVIPARAQGIPIVSIAAVVQHNDSSFMSLEEDGITQPKDLEGKTYAGFGGVLELALLEQLVSCDGGDPSTIEHVEVGNANYLALLEDDEADFVWIFEGWDGVRAREVEKKPIATLKFRDHFDCIPDWYTPVIITSESMIAENEETVRNFMAATARGYEAAGEDAEASADALLEGAPELDEPLVRAAAEYYVGKYVDDGRQWGLQDEAIWTEFVRFLLDAGLIEEQIDVAAAYTNDFIPEED
jgi:ABC-type nitrate/sulfonate/bicarbonate transport system substrate-binding protein